MTLEERVTLRAIGNSVSKEDIKSGSDYDAVKDSLKELISEYGEDGYFDVDGNTIRATQLLCELEKNTRIGNLFRKMVTKTIVEYFMKFGY